MQDVWICEEVKEFEVLLGLQNFVSGAISYFTDKHELQATNVNVNISVYTLQDQKSPMGSVTPFTKNGVLETLEVECNYNIFQEDVEKGICQLIETIAHEFVHVKQLISGKMKCVEKNYYSWNDRLIEFKVENYKEFPWEVEAYALQHQYALEFIEFYFGGVINES